MFYPEKFSKKKSGFRKAFHDAGQFYLAKPKLWFKKDNLFEDSIPFLIPNWRVQDIDEEDDWKGPKCYIK